MEVNARLLPVPLYRACGRVPPGGDLRERESARELQGHNKPRDRSLTCSEWNQVCFFSRRISQSRNDRCVHGGGVVPQFQIQSLTFHRRYEQSGLGKTIGNGNSVGEIGIRTYFVN